ncbi:hypothetical protein [Bacillus sp. S/N-304-OC-R1]|uniref:hypothetical protein n=1 Tax=Bacillus sp. S/N-304-OC-R1 TaxID=2758034 RepID=UPI001C8D1F28|nr:hypothetical protein [Bacillus sp. S/N-304-OC-R1]MBY0123618.1 hypothetical protein [Bacillus sp. S/N-304-OC-R1]
MDKSKTETGLSIVEIVSDILLEFLSKEHIDTDELTNYWGGETPIKFIIDGNEDEEEWK